MRLIYNKDDKYFYLHGPKSLPASWEVVHPILVKTGKPGLIRTNSFSAAAAFRSYGDDATKRIFKRAFQELYETPSGLGPLSKFLDPHQVRGVEWILSRKRSYLAHAPGAGKTAQAIVASQLSKGDGQNVFIVPPSLVVNWEREIIKFTEPLGVFPTIGVVPVTSRAQWMPWRAEFIIVPDSMLTKEWVYDRLEAMKIRFLAVDEASRFKESETERARALFGGKRAARSFRGLCQRPRHVVLLDGSPMPNGRPMELWAPLFALVPETIECMGQFDFGLKYCGAFQDDRGDWKFIGSSNEAEFARRLRENFMHVVLEGDLDHPERQRSILFLSEDVRTSEMKSWERKNVGKISFKNLKEKITTEEISSHRKKLGLRKVPLIAKYVLDKLRDKNESILLFVWHREVAFELASIFKKSRVQFGTVIGGTDAKDREVIFERFQNGKLKVIIGNIQAMGRGHNLQRADRVVFGEPSWSDELNKQCEKRASRRGNEKLFTRCEYLVAPHSMDEPVINSLFTKGERTKKVIG